ncbi:MAG: hypothetical protein ACOYJD_04705 [Christensenellales bacterium]
MEENMEPRHGMPVVDLCGRPPDDKETVYGGIKKIEGRKDA